VSGDRARGAVLYASAAVLVAAGFVWWVQAAPPAEDRPKFKEWQQSAMALLPDNPEQVQADTVALSAGGKREVVAPVGTGEFVVTIVCVGGEDSQVRVSLGDAGTDSGHGLRCAGERRPEFFSVAIADPLRMTINVGEAGPVVFRYSLLRAVN